MIDVSDRSVSMLIFLLSLIYGAWRWEVVHVCFAAAGTTPFEVMVHFTASLPLVHVTPLQKQVSQIFLLPRLKGRFEESSLPRLSTLWLLVRQGERCRSCMVQRKQKLMHNDTGEQEELMMEIY